ncbi:MAG: elongation factor 4, partial [Chloroflexi bacterium]|nr:elongation factor 4 [Chloroflexota bacterium]
LIPIVNKIDLPLAEPERVAQELVHAFGFKEEEIVFASAKEGTGVSQILDAIIARIPPPRGGANSPLRALIFDSKYDSYKGVLAYVRVVDGGVRQGDRLLMLSTATGGEALEVGVFRPQPTPAGALECGEVGYIATGLKNVRECRVGDTVTLASRPSAEGALPGYRHLKPMVFAGLYPAEGESYEALRDALDKLQLNDAALLFEPENSAALGFGFRCGFLGLLHMDIVQERLEREYGLNLIATAPGVAYQVALTNGQEVLVDNPAQLPPSNTTQEVREPWLEVTIVTPARFVGPIMEMVTQRRGAYKRMEYLASASATEADAANAAHDARVLLEYEMPLSEVLVDFYDGLKSRTQGYASLDYALLGYRAGPLVRLDIMLNNVPVDALSFILHREKAYEQGRALVERLRTLIPRQLFEVAVQAAIGNRVIARETIRAMKKNVLAKCYGGDITRKRKLLQKQAEGKKRLKKVGHVEVPQEAFLAIMRLEKQ